MIRMIQSQSVDQAKKYFSEALQKSDYYVNDQELQGQFHGRLAERLGLGSATTREAFFALCENRNLQTNTSLTPLTTGDRTIFYDINFHAPKSVSILNMLNKDTHIQDAFQASVLEVMNEIENNMQTRVRAKNMDENRNTNEIVFAEFMHMTARPVDGSTPDPHLHTHCTVFDCTWDDEEEKIKAGQFQNIKRNMPYFQAKFHKKLSDKLIDLGYSITKTHKSFEINGLPKNVIGLFSKRTNEIGQFAKENNITNINQLSELGARTRSKKVKGMSLAELKSDWRRQISEATKDQGDIGDNSIRYDRKLKPSLMTTKECLAHSLKHSFERASVVPEKRLLASAYSHSIGHRQISTADIDRKLNQQNNIIKVTDRNQVSMTTMEILQEEKHMVDLAKQGIGQFTPLYDTAPNIKSEGQQKTAIEHLLTTTNQVSIVMGGAGTGKTTLMKEAVALIEKAGKEVIVVAPSSQASRKVLRDEGFEGANTVSRLLIDKEMQAKLANNVLWVDEAGLLGNKEMIGLLELAKANNTRVILGGDTRQHQAVIRGDALRIINTIGGITAAEVNKIYRQKNANYRDAVQDLTKGQVKDAFLKLDNMGSIKEIDKLNPNKELVTDYVATLKAGKSALIVSPTHAQGESVTLEVREQLKASKVIGKKETPITKLKNLNLTEAEKTDWRNFEKGQIIKFNQNIPKIKKGSLWSVADITSDKVTLKDKSGQLQLLPLERANDFDLYRRSEIGISKGDKVRITDGIFDLNKKRLDNGQALEVREITKSGQLILTNSKKNVFVLDKEFGHIDHNYYTTSHASQGKTVDEIFISQPESTFSATDAKQFYVSVSRGRDAAHIYTDDKIALLEHAKNTKQRQSALELTNGMEIEIAYEPTLERRISPIKDNHQKDFKQPARRYNDYEPGI